MRIRVLGPIEVVGSDGRPTAVEGRRPCLLLALLAGLAPQVVSSDRLADALWSEDLPVNPAAALHSQITRLRRRLPDPSVIETVADGYRLAAVDEVDWVVFERLIDEAGRVPPPGALTRLEAAIAMWRGNPFGAAGEHELLRPITARLEERRMTALEDEVAALLALERHADAIARVHALTAEYPLRERPLLLLMRSFAAVGRHAEALDAATAFRRTFRNELGIEPSSAVHELEAAILRHEPAARETAAITGPRPLPEFATSWVGRDDEVSALRSLVTTSRLVCVVGPGGVGKTRLVVEAARGLSGMTFPDGLWFVDLTRVRAPSDVAEAFAATLGVERQAGAAILERLVAALASRRSLLIVDNCEHVLDAVAEVLDVLLERTTTINVIATSRERLALAAERCVPLGSLELPDSDRATGPAVSLFVDRARAAFPAFTLDGAERAVCELCRSVDGLPLAIELTATQLATRSASEVLGDLGTRLASPTRRGRRDRHRSMHAVVGWSYDLLEPGDRRVFEQLAVFVGGFTVDAAAAVADLDAAETPQRVRGLVDRSLVAIESRGATTRYRLLEPIHDFAAQRLDASGGAAAARDRHAAWFAELVTSATSGLRGTDEAAWMGVLDSDLANVRSAFRHFANTADREGCLRLLEPLYEYVWSASRSEVGLWAEEAIERFGDGPDRRLGSVCAVAGLAAWHRGDAQRARYLAERGVDLSSDRRDAGLSIEILGDVATLNGELDDAIHHYEEAVAIARTGEDTRRLVVGLCNVALARAYANDVAGAHPVADEAASLAQRTANPTSLAFAAYTAGEIRAETAPRDALPFLERAVALAHAARNRFIAGIAGMTQVSVAARVGNPRVALATYPPLLDHWQQMGAWRQQWTTVRTLVETLVRAGRVEPAAVLFGALSSSPRASPLGGADAQRLGVACEVMRGRLGDQHYAELLASGAELGDDAAIAFARATLVAEASAGAAVGVVTRTPAG